MKPAETFPPIEFIADECEARGWTLRDLAERMGGDTDLNHCTLDLMTTRDKRLRMDLETATKLGVAFGTGPEVWMNLDKMWRDAT